MEQNQKPTNETQNKPVDTQAVAQVKEQPKEQPAEQPKGGASEKVEVNKNTYFFPDAQIALEADSLKDALKQFEALKAKENK